MKATAEQARELAPDNINFAALQVLDPSWFRIWKKLGLSVVVVQANTQKLSPIHDHPRLEQALGLELWEIGAGHYDSTIWLPGGSAWHCFLCLDVGRAVERLKSQLKIRGLLPVVNILVGESPDEFAIWFSHDVNIIGETITTTVEPTE